MLLPLMEAAQWEELRGRIVTGREGKKLTIGPKTDSDPLKKKG